MVNPETIRQAIPHVLKEINIPELGQRQQGKVRDYYVRGSERVIATTDRVSAFDQNVGFFPFKGAALNQLAAFWFGKTQGIIRNHLIDVPDPNVSVVQNCEPIPIEMIVRGFMTGVTDTSVWGSYQRGEREIYGIQFPDGLNKNDRLPQPIITPTTKGTGVGGHDERLTRQQIMSSGRVSPKEYEQMEEAALSLYDFGSEVAERNGLRLVDTKYEFGKTESGVVLIDEVHTPDSSRFWLLDNLDERLKAGQEPENYDKEFLRLWYVDQGYRGDGIPPEMSEKLIESLVQRYLAVYEKITGNNFEAFEYPIEQRIRNNLRTLIF